MTFFPISTSCLCIYAWIHMVVDLFWNWDYFITFRELNVVLIPRTLLGFYIIAWCKIRRHFCCSYAASGGLAHSWVAMMWWASIFRNVLLFQYTFVIYSVLLDIFFIVLGIYRLVILFFRGYYGQICVG